MAWKDSDFVRLQGNVSFKQMAVLDTLGYLDPLPGALCEEGDIEAIIFISLGSIMQQIVEPDDPKQVGAADCQSRKILGVMFACLEGDLLRN